MNTGGAAFPVIAYHGFPPKNDLGYLDCENEGMTLRDYFAAKIITAIIPQPITCEDFDDINNESGDCINVFAKTAYLIADAMIKEREKESIVQEVKP